MSIRITLLAPGGRTRAVQELPPSRQDAAETGPDAPAARRRAGYLTRPRPVRRRAACAAETRFPPGVIII